MFTYSMNTMNHIKILNSLLSYLKMFISIVSTKTVKTNYKYGLEQHTCCWFPFSAATSGNKENLLTAAGVVVNNNIYDDINDADFRTDA